MNAEQTDDFGLSDRGVGVQAAGFAVVGCASVAILHLLSNSDYPLYQWFETAVTRLYWAFVVPLAALFDWGRIMFAKGKAIREAKKAEILAKMRADLTPTIVAELTPTIVAELTPTIRADLTPTIAAELTPTIVAELTPKIEAEVMQRNAEQVRRRIEAEVMQRSAEQERRRIEAVLARYGVELDKEVADELFGDSHSS